MLTIRWLRPLALIAALALAWTAGATVGSAPLRLASTIWSQDDAAREEADWGTFYTYHAGETHGTVDGLAAVAVIDPGEEIHPPHRHAEEEYLMVLEGEGTWHLLGEERPAVAGDLLYAAPWDVHGITNTGDVPLRFVVWKWTSKGVDPPAASE